VPTRFLKSWIEAHYSDRLLTALEAEIGGIASISIGDALVDGRATPPTPPTPANQLKANEPARSGAARAAPASASRGRAMREEGVAIQRLVRELAARSPSDLRLVSGRGARIRLAYSAAQRVIEDRSGQPAFSPL